MVVRLSIEVLTWHQSRSTDLPDFPDEDNSIAPVAKKFYTAEGCVQKIHTAEGCDTNINTAEGCVKKINTAEGCVSFSSLLTFKSGFICLFGAARSPPPLTSSGRVTTGSK